MTPPRDTLRGSELVSVVIPAFNAEATLRQTIESALAQTYPDLEVVVVDDGSQDRTAAIAAELARRDLRVRLLQRSNGGPAAARNHGIAHARGALIAPLDADDLWHPEKIAKQVATLCRSGDRHALVYTWTALLDGRGRLTGRCMTACHEGSVYPLLLLYNFVGTASSPLMRRGCVLEVGGFDEDGTLRGTEDVKLFLSLAERYKFAVVPELLTGYRQMHGSVSHELRAMRQGYNQIMASARCRHPELPGRLFRWSESKFCLQQATKALQRRRFLPAVAALCRAFWYDPAFPLTLPFGRKLTQFVSDGRAPWHGQPFLPPRADLHSFETPSVTWLEERRRAYAEAIRSTRHVDGDSPCRTH